MIISRRLNESDRQLWESFARELQPLKGKAPDLPPELAPASARPRLMHETQPRQPESPGAAVRIITVGTREPGLDNTSWRMLSTGRMRPQRTLDLHGRTVHAAFSLLHGFLSRAQTDRLRCVEIITGLGSGIEGGVLKRELPLWLSRPDLHPLVLATSYSHPSNQGAVRLLLRRGSNR